MSCTQKTNKDNTMIRNAKNVQACNVTGTAPVKIPYNPTQPSEAINVHMKQ